MACAIGLECLNIYEETSIWDHVKPMTPTFQLTLKQLETHPLVGEVRGEGFMLAIEFVSDKAAAGPSGHQRPTRHHPGERVHEKRPAGEVHGERRCPGALPWSSPWKTFRSSSASSRRALTPSTRLCTRNSRTCRGSEARTAEEI